MVSVPLPVPWYPLVVHRRICVCFLHNIVLGKGSQGDGVKDPVIVIPSNYRKFRPVVVLTYCYSTSTHQYSQQEARLHN